ncbi:Hypothetical predicted protein [Paramuricea clavata]|uniref:Uncharacterized protein n=1 Tax=Paramuricea clavata TaxID=317549 RepID=A0A6S7JDK0_PARCT|nr:Hypothetical predicted protein [Paramuricea clavata]
MEQAKWEEVVSSWMSGKSFELSTECENGVGLPIEKEKWQITDLENILIRQMQSQLILSVGVPKRVQGPTFTYLLNCKQMLVGEIFADMTKRKEKFEKKTGVSLDNYYRLAASEVENGKKRKKMSESNGSNKALG